MAEDGGRRGFALIDVAVVTGVVALLGATAAFVLNPADLLKESRDVERISALGKMNAAMGLLFATSDWRPARGVCAESAATSTSPLGEALWKGLDMSVPVPRCYQHAPSSVARCEERYEAPISGAVSASRKNDGSGWVPMNLSRAAGGTLLAEWPIDPKEDGMNFYSFVCRKNGDSVKWEFAAHMESARYAAGGPDDVESTDGGNRPGLLEVGTDMEL